MNNEDYVSYELALALKKAGFNEPCDSYYIKDTAPDGTACIVPTTDREDFNADSALPFCKPLCSAPTLAHAQKWLREVKGVDVEVRVCIVDGGKGYEAYVIPPYALTPTKKDYKSALSAGIASALELIKKGE